MKSTPLKSRDNSQTPELSFLHQERMRATLIVFCVTYPSGIGNWTS